jgi:hypothetical protein
LTGVNIFDYNTYLNNPIIGKLTPPTKFVPLFIKGFTVERGVFSSGTSERKPISNCYLGGYGDIPTCHYCLPGFRLLNTTCITVAACNAL